MALAALLFVGLPLHSSSAYVAVSVGIAPPPIVAYEQPYCPGPGYIWTPGYWGYTVKLAITGFRRLGPTTNRRILLDTSLLGLSRWAL